MRGTRAGDAGVGGLAVAAVAGQERRRLVERSRVEMIRGYADSPGCRRAFLLGYFGEAFDPPCASCDRCRAAVDRGDSRGAQTGDANGAGAETGAEHGKAPFAVNDHVRHATFGPGVVTGVEPDRVTVAFDDVGYRTIATAAAEESGVLVADKA